MHESGIAIILGLGISALLHFGFDIHYNFDIEGFLFVFLPPILFTEGFSIRKGKFFKNFLHILLYGNQSIFTIFI